MRFIEWRQEQVHRMPHLTLPNDTIALDADDEHDDGEEILGLPSEMSMDDLKQWDLKLAASYELKIRVGLAFDLLDEVRQAVRHSAAYLESKKKNVRGTKGHLRAGTEIKKQTTFAHRVAQGYNHNLLRISSLRTLLSQPANANDIASRLKKINPNMDLNISALSVPRNQGDSKKSGSWIWSIVDTPRIPGARTSRKRKRKGGEDAEGNEEEDDDEDQPADWKLDGAYVCSH